MDAVHGWPPGTAGRAFREHQKKLIKNQEYFRVSANEQIDELRRFNCGARRGKPIILLVSAWSKNIRIALNRVIDRPEKRHHHPDRRQTSNRHYDKFRYPFRIAP